MTTTGTAAAPAAARAADAVTADPRDYRIGPEDVLNPHDFPELKAHPTFEYEDGILAGLVAAQIAVRAEIRMRVREPEGT